MIGGASVYAAFLPHADRLVVTEVDVARRRRHLGAGARRRQLDGSRGTPDAGWSAVRRRPARATPCREYERADVTGPCRLAPLE